MGDVRITLCVLMKFIIQNNIYLGVFFLFKTALQSLAGFFRNHRVKR